MSKANATTGRLRVGGKTVTSELNNEEKKNRKKHKTDNYNNLPLQPPIPPNQSNQYEPTSSSYPFEETSMPTEKLASNEGADATTVLNDNSPDYPAKKFVITKKIVSVNTSETIN